LVSASSSSTITPSWDTAGAVALKDLDRVTNAASLSQSLNPHRERLTAHAGD
jgi:hypothetical protein